MIIKTGGMRQAEGKRELHTNITFPRNDMVTIETGVDCHMTWGGVVVRRRTELYESVRNKTNECKMNGLILFIFLFSSEGFTRPSYQISHLPLLCGVLDLTRSKTAHGTRTTSPGGSCNPRSQIMCKSDQGDLDKYNLEPIELKPFCCNINKHVHACK